MALNNALKEVCNYEISLEDHYKHFNGAPTKVKLNRLTEQGIISVEQHKKVYELKQKFTLEIIESKAEYRPEKVEMIGFLKNNNCEVACFTNSIRQTALLMLYKTGVLGLLDKILTNEDVKNPKPDPEGYIFLVNDFNVNKKDVIIVEDSPKGIQAAKASGCEVIEVENPDQVSLKLFKRYFK